jgi:hypothetical protein
MQQAYYLGLPLQAFCVGAGFDPQRTRLIHGVLEIGLIVALVALIQLRPPARWLGVVLLVVATLLIADIVLTSNSEGQPISLRAYVMSVISVSLNIACVAYLARKRFGDTCRQYRAAMLKRQQDKDALKMPNT